jgi:aryl-alcohol dehydrogenase-like predicted oxidoreductase
MDYRRLGNTGLKASPLCLGCMMFGPRGNNDHDDCMRIIHRALDAGINFLDTANVYSSSVSEEIVGKALRGRRDAVVLANPVITAPIIGPCTMEHLEGVLRAPEIRIPPEQLRRSDQLVPPGTDV